MNHQLYTPILKYKQAEEMALRLLKDAEKKRVAPLIQLVHKYRRIKNADGTTYREEISEEEVLSTAINKICRCLTGFPKIYFDPQPLYPSLNNDILKALSDSSKGLFGSNIIPVFTLRELKANDFDKQSKEFIRRQGICLRIIKEDINSTFWLNIDSLLSKESLSRANVDIIFDYKISEKGIVEHFCEQVKEPDKLNGWRSITFASGAFRKDFVGLSVNTYKFDRLDWLYWKKLIQLSSSFSKINYSDYSIQYPIYDPPPERTNPSRSIRYALEDKWIVMKGQSDDAKGSAKLEQYYAHAKMLVDRKFVMPNCCLTDSQIIKLSNNPNGDKGSFQRWIKLGIIHHIVLTIKQISNLN